MAIKFQYNKTFIQDLNRQLAIRLKALPILQNKETALRKEVKQKRVELKLVDEQKQELMTKVEKHKILWSEFPNILFVKGTKLKYYKVIGVKIPKLDEVEFQMADFGWWNFPAWFPMGIKLLKEALTLEVKEEVLLEQISLLDAARKKTTQKVNLYEKVQIPEMEEAILKIKRFLEDKENISKAGQKIMKKRQLEREAA